MNAQPQVFYVHNFDHADDCDDVMIYRVKALSAERAIQICRLMLEPDTARGEEPEEFVGYCEPGDVKPTDLRLWPAA